MSIPTRPNVTRLRWVSAKDPLTIQIYLSRLGQRVHINQIVPKGSKWFLWFTPGDVEADITSGDLDG